MNTKPTGTWSKIGATLQLAVAILRSRAWWGSFVFTTLSLFVALYIALMTLMFVHYAGWSGRTLWEFVYVVPAALVLGSLLRGRDDYLRRADGQVA